MTFFTRTLNYVALESLIRVSKTTYTSGLTGLSLAVPCLFINLVPFSLKRNEKLTVEHLQQNLWQDLTLSVR